MKQRIVFGLIMIAALVGILYLDYWLEATHHPLTGVPVGVLVALASAVGAAELSRLAKMADLAVMELPAVIMSAVVSTAPVWMQPVKFPAAALWLLIAAAVVVVAFACQMICYRLDRAIVRLSTTVFFSAYLGLCGATILALRVTAGLPVLVLFLTAVKVTDIGAYFTGSFIGKHKMIPWLSPGKSWEGLVGGLAIGVVVTGVIWRLLGPGSTNIIDGWKLAVGALILGLVGQFGDLCESLLKRAAAAKDAGRLVPQFGGVMDIMDSPLIAAPVAYALWIIMLL